MNLKERINFFKKIAQTANPPRFVPSEAYPAILKAFNLQNVSYINQIADLTNSAMHYASGGKHNIPELRSQNFSFSTTSISDLNLKHLMEFSKELYYNLFKNKTDDFKKPLEKPEIANIINILKNSTNLNQITNTNPSSELGKKINGNLRTKILDALNNIK